MTFHQLTLDVNENEIPSRVNCTLQFVASILSIARSERSIPRLPPPPPPPLALDKRNTHTHTHTHKNTEMEEEEEEEEEEGEEDENKKKVI